MTLEQMIRNSMETMLERFSRHNCGDFIDTKFDVETGEDFAQEDSYRGKSHVYGWIQAQGIESLAKHAQWFENHGNSPFANKLDKMLDKVLDATLDAIEKNGDVLPFVMAPDGTPYHKLSTRQGYGDLFLGKGLLAAARRLNDTLLTKEAHYRFTNAINALKDGQFRSDQLFLNPITPVEYVPGKKVHGPRTAALDGLADFLEAMPDERFWLDTGMECINGVLQQYIMLPVINKQMYHYEMTEAIDKHGVPWRENGVVISAPGHSMEYFGHLARFLKAARRFPEVAYYELNKGMGLLYTAIACYVFSYGYSREAHGMVKTFDLTNYKKLDTDMPSRSLTAAVRTMHLIDELYPDLGECPSAVKRKQTALDDFQKYYLRPSGFAVKTRDAQGNVVKDCHEIPDADPGYYTNLPLLECGELKLQ